MERQVLPIRSTGEWLSWHEKGGDVTASVCAAVFGVHPYMTREKLATRILGLERSGTTAPKNTALKRGTRFEPAVAATAADEHPHWRIEKANEYFRIPELRLGCTPDYYVTDPSQENAPDGLLEIKTAHPDGWEKRGGKAHIYQVLQASCQVLVTGRPWCVLASMVMRDPFPVYYQFVPHHPEVERLIMAEVARFLAEVEAGSLGGPGSVEGIAEMLDDGSVVDLSKDGELPALLAEREACHEAANAADKRADAIDAIVREKVGAAARANLPGWLITYKTHHREERLMPARDIRTLRIRRAHEEEEEVI